MAFAPGAAHATKRWPAERWVELGRRLNSRGFDLALVGGSGDADLAAGIASGLDRAASAAGRLSLQGTAALLASCRGLVSGDTGVMHMAAAVGTPVVAIFGPTVRAFGFFPYAQASAVVERELACRPCTAWGTERCPLGHHHCMVQIPADEVESALTGLIQ